MKEFIYQFPDPRYYRYKLIVTNFPQIESAPILSNNAFYIAPIGQKYYNEWVHYLHRKRIPYWSYLAYKRGGLNKTGVLIVDQSYDKKTQK